MGRGGSASGMYGVCGPPTEGCGGQRARDERTSKMLLMYVTLDVSKLSGWLKADADCRVKRRAYTMRGERCCGPAARRKSGMHGGRDRLKAGDG